MLGAASAFIECTLAQIYKTRSEDGTYIGGQAYYAERALGIKWFGTAMAVILVGSNVFGNPCVQSNTISTAVANAFQIPAWIVGLAIAGAMALVVFGGIRRLAALAEKIVPTMCIVYLTIAVILIGANFAKLPGAIGLIFSSAFNPRSAFGGMMGTALVWGVRRGVYSNEAGQGTGTAPAAAADADNPCDQGLVQALSVYIDTLVVCTISALCMLCTNCYNVLGVDGSMVVEYLPGLPDGIPYVQSAIASVLPLGEIIVAFLITTFAFTSLMSYYLEAEIHIEYLTMKLIIAIINYDDANAVTQNLSKNGFSSTRLATTGGFLLAGNVTLLTGVKDDQVQQAIDLIRECSHSRKQMVPALTEMSYGFMPVMPVEVTVGGATVFVVDVERFERL